MLWCFYFLVVWWLFLGFFVCLFCGCLFVGFLWEHLHVAVIAVMNAFRILLACFV